MSHYLKRIAFEAEQCMILGSQWDQAPFEAQRIAENSMDDGPTGIAYHDTYGWMVVGAGQGPFIIWSEKPLPEE